LTEIAKNLRQKPIIAQHFEYDNFGNVIKETYPSGYVIDRQYDTNNGYLTQVDDQQSTIYTTLQMNAFNQYTAYSQGNSITQRTYDDYGLVTNIKAGLTGTVQDLAFAWNNNTGNLTLRGDVIKAQAELFDYDNLNRLTSGAPLSFNPSPTLTMGYDANGNILNKTDAGVYAYNSSKPHAVTDVTNPGETISSITQDIAYTPFNKTASITEGDYELLFTYGTENQRKKTELRYQTNTERTITYSGAYEKIEDISGDTYEVHYIVCGPGLSAINVIQNNDGVNHLFYVYTDHLGSILTLTDDAGNVVFEQNFDPWGRKRNPNDWSYDFSSYVPPTVPSGLPDPNIWLTRGFTGHEHLDEFALINMNGRMYDPILGRVLSTDNFVQDNTATQGYNRYSYAFNNPLIYTDPTGELAWFVPVIVGAAIGAYTGASIQSETAEFWNWDRDAWKGAIVGGVIGAGLGLATSYGLAAGNAQGFWQITKIAAEPLAVGAKSLAMAPSAAWYITSQAIVTANVNLASSIIQGSNLDRQYKSALIGLAAGGIGSSIGYYTTYGTGSGFQLNRYREVGISKLVSCQFNIVG